MYSSMKRKSKKIVLFTFVSISILVILFGIFITTYLLLNHGKNSVTNDGFTLGVQSYDSNGNLISGTQQTAINGNGGFSYISFKIYGSNTGNTPLNNVHMQNSFPNDFTLALKNQSSLRNNLSIGESNVLLFDTATSCSSNLECASNEKCLNNKCLVDITTFRQTTNYGLDIVGDYNNAFGSINNFITSLSIPLTFSKDIFLDDFESFNVGQNNLPPTYIPQYASKVNITNSDTKEIFINAYSSFGGDRDVHVELNRTDLFPDNSDTLSASVDYRVIDWNSTQVVTIGNSIYLHYADGNNFLSGEWKVNKVTGTGLAQLSTFKRVGGVSTTLCTGSCPSFTTTINQTVNSKMTMIKYNSTNYNVTFYVNNIPLVSSTNVGINEVLPGKTLPMEATGTKVYYDNLNVTN